MRSTVGFAVIKHRVAVGSWGTGIRWSVGTLSAYCSAADAILPHRQKIQLGISGCRRVRGNLQFSTPATNSVLRMRGLGSQAERTR